jgi:hypothetical protein
MAASLFIRLAVDLNQMLSVSVRLGILGQGRGWSTTAKSA